MKKIKSIILFLGGFILILLSINVNAESDPSDDVYYHNGVDEDVIWNNPSEKDTIDITDVSQSISGADITVSLTIKGEIANNPYIMYHIYLYKNMTSYYTVYYSNGSGMASAIGDLQDFTTDTDPDFSLSDDEKTLYYTFSNIETVDYIISAYAVEHSENENTIGESWYDNAPDTKEPNHSNGNSNQVNQPKSLTPGFEILIVILSIFVGFVIHKRMK